MAEPLALSMMFSSMTTFLGSTSVPRTAGERPVEWAGQVLANRVRRTGGVTAHPYGLYLVQVEYPAEFGLPVRYLGPHFLSGLPDIMADA